MATALSQEAVRSDNDYTRPPFLRRVRIWTYKSIAYCDVPLQPLTILVGRNAAGKSNFLDALAFLRDVLDTSATEAVKRHGGWASVVFRTAEEQTIGIEIEAGFSCGPPRHRVSANGPSNESSPGAEAASDLEGRRFVAKYQLEVSGGRQVVPTIRREKLDLADETGELAGGFDLQRGSASAPRGGGNGAPSGTSVDVLYWKTSPAWPRPDAAANEALARHRTDQSLLAALGFPPFLDLGDALRQMGFYNVQPNAVRQLQKPLQGTLLDKDGSNLASVIRSLAEIDPKSRQRVQEYLAEIAEEVKEFEAVPYGEYETVQFRLRSGKNRSPLEFDAASMSDGTLRVLSHLMAAFQIVLPHGHPSVVGIEEPETALHPAALRALVDALREATQHTQILLTTHSPDLLADRYLDLAGLLVVRSRDGLTQIAPVDAASREIVRKELYTLADLQRMDHLEPDAADLARQTQAMSGNREK